MYTAKRSGLVCQCQCQTNKQIVVVVVVSHNEILNTLGEEESCGARFEFQKFKNMKRRRKKKQPTTQSAHYTRETPTITNK